MSVERAEALMLGHFRRMPFHNLPLICEPLARPLPGGTCSDLTLSFVADCRRAGLDAALHSGFINGEEVHRLARLRIEGRDYFADVGNGWPSLRLYPAEQETSYRCFGMRFRTQLEGGRVRVFHRKSGKESLQLEIEVRGRPESEIRQAIEKRFSSGIVYPFGNGIRLSRIVGNRFLFLRDDRLESFSDLDVSIYPGIDDADLPKVIRNRFGYDVGKLVRLASEDEPADTRDRREEGKAA